MGSGFGSLVISLLRQMVFVFPFAVIFVEIAKNNADLNWLLWVVFPIAEILTAVAAVIIFMRIAGKNRARKGINEVK